MTTIVTRSSKGFPLTDSELDTNFNNLNTYKLDDAFTPTRANTAPSLSLDFTQRTLDSRITFTRASTATYYGDNTIVDGQNLVTYSQDFTNAGWTKSNSTVRFDPITSPDGFNVACSLTDTAVSNWHDVYSGGVSVAGSTYTGSVYLKYNTLQYAIVSLASFGTPASWNAVTVDLINGVVTQTTKGTTGTIVSSSIASVGNGWYRVIITASIPQTDLKLRIALSDVATPTIGNYCTYAYTGTGTGSIYLWGSQLEQRSSVTAYTLTTTNVVNNYIPVLQTAANNTARFDTNPVTKESLGLFLEPASTNCQGSSSDFNNPSYLKLNVTLDSNVIVAPDGTITGTKMTGTGAGASFLATPGTGIYGTAYTNGVVSIYAKAGTQSTVNINDNYAGVVTWFNLLLGTCSSNGSIIPVGNGWYRCISYVSAFSYLYRYWYVALGSVYPGITTTTYAYIWGMQIEPNFSFATSYIPTPLTYSGRASTATYTGTNGLIQTASPSVPRYELNSTGTPQLLLEAAATNFLSYSNNFSQFSPWAYQSLAKVIPNCLVAPDGNFTGTRIVATAALDEHFMEQTISTTTNQTYTQSIYVKPDSTLTRFGFMAVSVGASSGTSIQHFAVSSSGVISLGNTFGLITSSSIIKVSNGWTRISITYTLDGTVTSHRMRIYPITVGSATTVNGDGITGLGVWGSQIEVGSVPTSYIPSVETFTSRANTATYYDSGTTALAEQNLFLYSQDFTQNIWTKGNVDLSTGFISPDGNNNAIKIIANSTSASHYIGQAAMPNTNYTFSIYAKAGEYGHLAIASTVGNYIYFDLTLGAVESTLGTGWSSASITPVGSGWYRCSGISNTTSSGSVWVYVYNSTQASGNSAPTFSGDGISGIYVWGPQLEQRSANTVYTPTTTTAITNYIPKLLTAPINAARYDFDPITRLYKGLTLEPASTNIIYPSATAGDRSDGSSTLIMNSGIAPDGSNTAIQMIPTTSYYAGYYSYLIYASGITGTVTESIYFKPSDSLLAYGSFSAYTSNSAPGRFTYNFSTKTYVLGSLTLSALVVPVGNGWYRASTTYTDDGTSKVRELWVFGIPGGTTYSYCLLWGRQVEAGSVATSYIPTTTVPVTRAADISTSTAQTRAADVYSSSQVTRAIDAASMPVTGWYNTQQGTQYIESQNQYNALQIAGMGAAIYTAYRNNTFLINSHRDNLYYPAGAVVSWGLTGIGSIISTSGPVNSFTDANAFYKGAASISSTSMSISYMNNTLGTVTGSFLVPNPTTLGFNLDVYAYNPFSGHIKKFAYYPKQLSSNELVGLTT